MRLLSLRGNIRFELANLGLHGCAVTKDLIHLLGLAVVPLAGFPDVVHDIFDIHAAVGMLAHEIKIPQLTLERRQLLCQRLGPPLIPEITIALA